MWEEMEGPRKMYPRKNLRVPSLPLHKEPDPFCGTFRQIESANVVALTVQQSGDSELGPLLKSKPEAHRSPLIHWQGWIGYPGYGNQSIVWLLDNADMHAYLCVLLLIVWSFDQNGISYHVHPIIEALPPHVYHMMWRSKRSRERRCEENSHS